MDVQVPPTVSLKLRDAVYTDALDDLELRPAALADLERRGLSRDQALEAGYRSIPRRGMESRDLVGHLVRRYGEEVVRAVPGFTDKNRRLTMPTAFGRRDGYLIPYRDAEGRITGCQVRFADTGYRSLRGSHHADLFHLAGVAEAGGDLYVTEGATKANVAAALAGLAVVAVPGLGLQSVHVAAIARLAAGRVIVALDQEANPNTAHARDRWIHELARAGLSVALAVWEGADCGGPKGIDDLVLVGGRPRIRPVHFPPAEISRPRHPRPVAEPGSLAPGGSQADAQVTTERAISEFLSRRKGGEALLVATPPGTGKTLAAGRELCGPGWGARVVVGTERLAREIADRFGFHVIRGRNADNCARIPAVHALAEAGHPVEKLACGSEEKPRCPHRVACVYYRQFKQSGVWIGAAEQLFNVRFVELSRVVVVDDADLGRSLIERVRISREAIFAAREHPAMVGRRPLRRVLDLVAHALIELERPALGMGAWDELARSAARHGEDLPALIAALPKQPTLPDPEALGPLEPDDVHAVPPRTLLRLAEARREELAAFRRGEPFNSRIRIDPHGVDVRRVRAHVARPRGWPPIADAALLVLDATPVEPLVQHLLSLHRRRPDVRAPVRLPEPVCVAQYATSPRGHTSLRDDRQLAALLDEVQAERRRMPVERPEDEGAVGFVPSRRRSPLSDSCRLRCCTSATCADRMRWRGCTASSSPAAPCPPAGRSISSPKWCITPSRGSRARWC